MDSNVHREVRTALQMRDTEHLYWSILADSLHWGITAKYIDFQKGIAAGAA